MADETPDPQSAKWWLKRLEDKLNSRLPAMQEYRDLVDDEHPEPDSVETSLAFQRIASLATTNLTGLAVEATAERMSVEGIRIGDEPEADKGFWNNVWQRSDFDAGSQDAITGALVYSRSMISVEPPNASSPYARMHYEDPRQVVIAHGPGGDRRAALKVWTDEWTGDVFGTLYLPTVIVKMKQARSAVTVPTPGAPRWLARDVGREDNVVTNTLGEVPFFELQNKLTGSIRSEVAPLVIPQRRLNQIVFSTDSVAEYGAFRQKWATNIEVPRGPDGKPIAPFDPNVTKLFVSEGQATFGNFDVTDMGPYIELANWAVDQIAAKSRVPATYFRTSVSNVSAEALALLVSSLVLKCQRRVTGYEPAIEGATRLALRLMGDSRADVANIEVKWADMETRSPAQSADAAVKLTQGDNPVLTIETAQEKYLKMAQTERTRDAKRREGAAPEDDVSRTDKINDAAVLIRAGFVPAAALESVGLDPIEHTGLVPVTVNEPEAAETPALPDGSIV